MTNEEAKAYFIDSNKQIISVAKDENMYNYETQQIEYVFMRRDFEAKELAIKALEQQPCEDCINRQAVNELVDELARAISDERCYMSRGRSTATIIQNILELPPVTPQKSWIPCSERLPEESGCYLITTKTKIHDLKAYYLTQEALFDGKEFYIGYIGDDVSVIAWQPKPKPYKEE